MLAAQSHLARPDYTLIAGYFVLMLGIGIYFSRYMRGMKDYFTGGNRIPWWLSGISFYMTSFSAQTFVQYSDLAYKYGWVAVSLYWSTVPAAVISALVFASRWRRARITSPVEYLETRYNPAVRQIFAWQGIPVRVIDDALKLVATGLFMQMALGLSVRESILWCGLIMLAYTFMGGVWAVTVTDFIQFIVQSAGVVVLVPLALMRVGGLHGLVQGSPQHFFEWTQPKADYGWNYVISQVLLFTLMYSTQWALIQRYYSVPRERDAQKVAWLVAVLILVAQPLMFLPAMAARQFMPVTGETTIYAAVCAELLPVGMMGLVVSAMFAATMSTLSGDYNVCASVLTNDVYRRLINPEASQQRLVWFGRLMTLVVGLVALGLALAIAEQTGEKLFRNMVTLFSIATPPVAISMLAGLLSRRVTGAAALAGFVAGMMLGLTLVFSLPDRVMLLGLSWSRENILLWSTVSMTIFWTGLTTWADGSTPEEQARVDAFVERLAAPIGELDEDREQAPTARLAGFSPFRVVGVCTLLIGALMLAVTADVLDPMARSLNTWIGGGLIALGGVLALLSRRRRTTAE